MGNHARLLVACLFWGLATASPAKDGKFLFSNIVFNNDPCSASGGMTGTCMTENECSSSGGTNSGACADQWGVCCTMTSKTCGSTVKTNNAYISTPDDFDNQDECVFTIEKKSSKICQYRLDFEKFSIAQPVTSATAGLGECSEESLAIEDGNGRTLITLCGDNVNQHVYIDAGSDSSDKATLTFDGHGFVFSSISKFDIRVTQIECDADDEAPKGCLQYHTEESGTVESFNFQGEHLIQNMDYTICIKTGDDMCGITYSEDPSEATAFLMSTREWDSAAIAAAGAANMAGPLQGDDCGAEAFISIIKGFTATSLDDVGVSVDYEATTTTMAPTGRKRRSAGAEQRQLDLRAEKRLRRRNKNRKAHKKYNRDKNRSRNKNTRGRNGDLSPVDLANWVFDDAARIGPQDRYCGLHLNGRSQDISGSATSASFTAANIMEDVSSLNLPMRIDVFSTTAAKEAAAFPAKAENPIGFKLLYKQDAC